MKATVSITPITHNKEKRIGVSFKYNNALIEIAKKVDGYRYSKSLRQFHYPNTKETLRKLAEHFTAVAEVKMEGDFAIPETKKPETVKSGEIVWELSAEGTQKLQKFKYWLQSKRYSASTIKTYADALKAFLKFYRLKPVSEITNDDVIVFNNEFVLKHKLSSSYQNQVVNAIKLFFSSIQNTKIQIESIHRPKRQRLLPNVLSKEEIKLILNAHSNLKHKTMLSLIYSCGLRRSELLNLKLSDVDSKRHLLIIRQSKGRKDRIAPLSEKTIELLRNYFVACKPKVWLFEGQDKISQYDANSLAAVLKQALQKSRITKPVSLHWLRHSYATHLLENGTDLRYIQEILGHTRSTVTEIYTHVSNKSLQKIVSPFDSL